MKLKIALKIIAPVALLVIDRALHTVDFAGQVSVDEMTLLLVGLVVEWIDSTFWHPGASGDRCRLSTQD